MKKTLGLHDFREEFRAYGRGDQFSYSGLEVLFNYLIQLEEDTGVELDLDVIGLCCEFVESDLDEVISQHDVSFDSDYPDEKADVVYGYLCENTSVCGRTNDSIVYLQF